MLKKLFGSGARVKLLRQFLLNQDQEFFIRELTRILDEQINSLRRELDNLEQIGLLRSKERNRKKYYIVNPHFALLSELTSIIRKTDDSYQALLKKISKLGEVDFLMLSGQFIGQEAPDALDIFVVGDIAGSSVENFLKSEFPDSKLKYGVMTKDDFVYRITLKDQFIKKLFAHKQNLILKNKIKKETEPFLSS